VVVAVPAAAVGSEEELIFWLVVMVAVAVENCFYSCRELFLFQRDINGSSSIPFTVCVGGSVGMGVLVAVSHVVCVCVCVGFVVGARVFRST
jgi:hypothetical protein